MAESIVFVSCSKNEALQRLTNFCPGVNAEIDEDGDYIYRGVRIYEFSHEWTILEDNDGEYFEEELIRALASQGNLIYVYVDEDHLSGELYVIENGEIIRKLCDYFEEDMSSCDIGRISYEDNHKLSSWIDIGSYLEYLFDNL